MHALSVKQTAAHVCLFCVCVVAASRLNIVSPLRASVSLQHVEMVAHCQDTSPSSVLTRRHEEQRLIIYKRTPVHRVWLGTSPALNVTIYEAICIMAFHLSTVENLASPHAPFKEVLHLRQFLGCGVVPFIRTI